MDFSNFNAGNESMVGGFLNSTNVDTPAKKVMYFMICGWNFTSLFTILECSSASKCCTCCYSTNKRMSRGRVQIVWHEQYTDRKFR